MKKSLTRFGALAGIALFAMGCAPDPDKVCARLEEVYKSYEDKPAYMKSRESCIEAMENAKSRRGVNSYRREAECILASDRVYQVRECTRAEED